MTIPVPSEIQLYRLTHINNLNLLMQRGGLHSPNNTPNDGYIYRTIHDATVQANRKVTPIPCGARGNVHDYVPFYFGTHSPMLLQLKTGQVAGYTEGQDPLIYLVTSLDLIISNGCRYVFSDGHGLATYTDWYDNLNDLDKIDWDIVKQKFWADTAEDGDRQRRKQAEFLVHSFCDWSLIKGIAVLNDQMKQNVEAIMANYPNRNQPPVKILPRYYY
ncbi:TPA: DUF4433 domain-containing protein [Legionella pneumophila]|nr:DUF4433 domain-containing protein [Legionella pneumophila]HAU1284673.1 DUF4433 domain-containing protein [Legionella pneumophila]